MKNKLIGLFLLSLLIPRFVFAQGMGSGGAGIGQTAIRNIKEADGSPSCWPTTLQVSNTTLTCSGGTATLNTSGGGSGTISAGIAGYFSYYPSDGTTLDDQLLLFTNGTNIGIGTISPIGKLDVRADEVRIWTGAGSDAQALGAGELYVEGDLEVDGSIYGNGANITGITSSAGWTDGGTNVYLTTLTDNVGIGTSQPVRSLDILGNGIGVNAAGDTYFMATGGNVGIGTLLPTGNLIIKGISTSSTDINFQAQNSATTPLVSIFNGGNVGIGSISPNSPLNVNGQIRSAAGTAAVPAFAPIGDIDTGILFPAANNMAFSTNATQVGIFDASGNLGVGTTQPVGRLSVIGDEARIWTGSGSDTNALASGELYVQGDLEVDGTLYSQGLTNNTSFWLCTDAICTAKCQVNIVGGLIISCP